jgi:membrane associated rhomboid family serine protease
MAQPGGPESGGPNDPDPPAEPRTSGLAVEFCYRHPDRATGVHCTRCGKPICTDCMRPAAVGYQCPECLQEAGKSLPRSRRVLAVGTPGPVTKALVGINVAVFILEVIRGGTLGVGLSSSFNSSLVAQGGLQPLEIAFHGEYYRLVTAMFLHGGLLHVALNMYVLWLLGSMIEPALGSGRFAAVYFISGLTASAVSYWLGPVQQLGVGASGAIFGLLGAWLAYSFRRRDTAFGAMQLRQALFWIGLNFVLGLTVPGIDNFAHLGGLIGGTIAGALVEGFGPPRSRAVVRVAGLAALVLVTVLIVVVRTASLQSQFPGFAFG